MRNLVNLTSVLFYLFIYLFIYLFGTFCRFSYCFIFSFLMCLYFLCISFFFICCCSCCLFIYLMFLSMKLGMADYVRHPTPHYNFGKSSATWVVWADMRLSK